MSKDSAFFLLPQGKNKASTEQKLCNFKYSYTSSSNVLRLGTHLLLFLKHIPITAVVSDYVIIVETPRPRQQRSAVTLLRYQNQPVGFSR